MSSVVLALVNTPFVPWARAANEELLERAVGMFVSSRGQAYIHQNFEAILFANGFSLREGGFPEWSYQSEEPVSLDRLPPQFEKFNPTFQKIRGILERWVKGFHLNDPRLAVFVRDIQYSAEFSRLGFRADYQALRDLKVDNAVVLVAEAEIPKLRIDVGSMEAGDLNNKFLGKIGVNGFWTATAAKTEPLKIKIPLLVELSPRKGLRIQVLKFTTNLPKVKLGFGFQKPLLLPKVEVIVNGYKMELDHRAIEDDLLKHQSSLVQSLQNFLKGKMEEQIPEMLSAVIEKKLGDVREVNEMSPPGAPEGKPVRGFRWGLVPAEVNHTPKSIYLGLGGFFEDPEASHDLPMRGLVQAKGAPALSGKYDGKYDIALALNQGLLNRVLQLSHERGYFRKVSSGKKGEFIRLADAPVFHFDHKGDREYVKLDLAVDYEPKGMEKVAIKGPLRVGFTMNVRLQRTANGGTAMIKDGLDQDSIRIDKSAIRFKFFEERVIKGVQEKIAAESLDMKKNPKALVDRFPVPEALFGVPIVTSAFEVLPGGYLVIYSEFGI